MNGQGSNICRAGGGFKFIELPKIPDDRSESVANVSRPWPGNDAADDEDARIWAKSARIDAFFNAGDAKPAGSRTHRGRRAELERMAVGIGLDDGEEFNLRSSEVGEKTIVVFEGAGRNFNPAGARMHQTVQSTV